MAEGTVLLMPAAMRRLLELDAATRAGRGWPTDAGLGETVRDIGALTDALRTNRLAVAGLDVFAVEPVRPDNPLLRLDNVVVTPHVAWYTQDTLRRYLAEAIDNCRRLRDRQDLFNVVNGRSGVRLADE